MSWHRSYRGRSIGRVLHFLYHYCGFNIAETAQIGFNKPQANAHVAPPSTSAIIIAEQ